MRNLKQLLFFMSNKWVPHETDLIEIGRCSADTEVTDEDQEFDSAFRSIYHIPLVQEEVKYHVRGMIHKELFNNNVIVYYQELPTLCDEVRYHNEFQLADTLKRWVTFKDLNKYFFKYGFMGGSRYEFARILLINDKLDDMTKDDNEEIEYYFNRRSLKAYLYFNNLISKDFGFRSSKPMKRYHH